MREEPTTGRLTTLAEDVGKFTTGRRGTVVLSRRPGESRPMTATVHDLVAGTHTPLPRHGPRVSCVALDPSGTIAVTGSWDGVVRVGPVAGEEPHWLVGHQGSVYAVAVSPDGRLVASGGSDGTIRLWPMPDLTKPPLHTLPRAELIARLKSLTNLRVVREADDPENFVVRADPFPGWRTVADW
jgi:WD40 repeat protein